MMKRLFIILICWILCKAEVSHAQTDLKNLVKQTLTYHPKLKEQHQALVISGYRQKITKSQYLPNLSADASYNYINPIPQAIISTPVGENKIQFQPANNYNTSIGLNQLVFDFGRTGDAVQKSMYESENITQSIASIENNLAYQVAGLYYSIVYLEKAIGVQQAQIELLQDNEKLIADKIESGDEIEYTLISTQVRRQNAEIRLADLQSQKDKQYLYLQNLSGASDILIPKNTGFALELSEISSNADLGGNYDLQISRLREKINALEIDQAKKNGLPTISLIGAIGYKNGIQPNINDFRFNYNIGARLSIPLFTGLRNQHQIQIGKENLSLSQYSSQNLELNIKTSLMQAEIDYKTAKEKLARSEAQVKQANDALGLANTRYENGIITNLDVVSAQTALQEALLNQLQYEYQMLVAKLEWNRISGIRFWEK